MKKRIRNSFSLPVMMISALGLILAGRVTAQTFRTLHSFTALNNSTNIDGAYPRAGLILSGGTLYGTASYGGSLGNGTVFKVNTDGTGFTNLHTFTAGSGPYYSYTNNDGANPSAGLVLSGYTLYGTAVRGSYGVGTVFAVNTDGTGFTNLHSFSALSAPDYSATNSDGAGPSAGLIISGNTLYGTTAIGGSSGNGTVFKVNTDGTGFTNLYNFTGNSDSPYTNNDGAHPYASLILSSNILYGTTSDGGSGNGGTLFSVKTDGTGFTNLHNFAYSDGSKPVAGLLLSDNIFYGTTRIGGSSGNGTVFTITKDGSGFTNLHSFTAASPSSTNPDGAYPYGRLILSGDTLFGTAAYGGSSANGTLFVINTDGTGFTNLHSFTGSECNPCSNSDGATPQAGLILSGNTLYGTSIYGGNSGNGTVFSLSFTPQLSITPSGPNVILTWPTNYNGFDYTGFTLQSATNLISPVWTTNFPAPVVIGGQNTITDLISGNQQFFRLSQ